MTVKFLVETLAGSEAPIMWHVDVTDALFHGLAGMGRLERSDGYGSGGLFAIASGGNLTLGTLNKHLRLVEKGPRRTAGNHMRWWRWPLP